MPKMGFKIIAAQLTRLGFNLTALTFAGLLVWMLVSEKTASWQALAICLAAALGAAVLGQIDQFQTIKGGPGGSRTRAARRGGHEGTRQAGGDDW